MDCIWDDYDAQHGNKINPYVTVNSHIQTYHESKVSKNSALSYSSVLLKQSTDLMTHNPIWKISHKYFRWHFFLQ